MAYVLPLSKVCMDENRFTPWNEQYLLCLHIYIVWVHVFETFLNCHKHFVIEKSIRMIECKGCHLISYDGIGDGFFVGPLCPLDKSAMYIIDIYS